MIRLPDGSKLDVPAPVRCFHRYDSETRSNMAASRRLGYRQRQAEGEFYWVHDMVPGVAFGSRKQAVAAVLHALANNQRVA